MFTSSALGVLTIMRYTNPRTHSPTLTELACDAEQIQKHGSVQYYGLSAATRDQYLSLQPMVWYSGSSGVARNVNWGGGSPPSPPPFNGGPDLAGGRPGAKLNCCGSLDARKTVKTLRFFKTNFVEKVQIISSYF